MSAADNLAAVAVCTIAGLTLLSSGLFAAAVYQSIREWWRT